MVIYLEYLYGLRCDMKKLKSIISVILMFVFLTNTICVFPANALDDNTNEVKSQNDGITITGTNTVGELLSETITEVQEAQSSNDGCNIFSAVVEDNIVILEVETVEDCTVVVGIYDENGLQLISSGYADVFIEDKVVSVEIETEQMPQYFYLKAFLVSSDTMRPLSSCYECPNYTREMQEFLSKTANDFAEEKVLNFDNSVENNFAIFSDETKIIPNCTEGNDFVTMDDASDTYVIENYDENIASLVSGDIFAYDCGNNDFLIVKVDTISFDGTTATIVGTETALDEVFSYLKIDTDASAQDATIDNSTLADGATFEGVVEVVDEDAPSTYAIDGDYKKSFALSYGLFGVKVGGKNFSAELNGSVRLQTDISLKVYISWSYQYFELRFDNSLELDGSVSASAEGKIPLATIGFIPIPGVIIEFTPSIVVKFSAEISINLTINQSCGFSYESGKGLKNLTSTPKVSTKIKIEGVVFLGLSLEPRIKIIHDKIAKVAMEAQIGAEIRAQLSNTRLHHSCNRCIEGVINGKCSVSFSGKILNTNSLSWSYSLLDKTVKVADFYYSLDSNSFGFGKCPNTYNIIKILVVDSRNRPVSGASINGTVKTNGYGKAEIRGEKGTNSITISKTGYSNVIKRCYVDNSDLSIRVTLCREKEFTTIKAKAISVNGNHMNTVRFRSYGYTAIIGTDGSLYTCGGNAYGQLGNGTKNSEMSVVANPVLTKIMTNVATVETGISHTAAITNNNDLYVWGGNRNGQIGYGDNTTITVTYPKYIMSGVLDVSLGWNYSAAVKSNGDLYMWGYNCCGQLGDGTQNDRYSPTLVMKNVKDVELGVTHSAAITRDGSLYMWGGNSCGELGNGSTKDSSRPIKIMDNVVSVSLGYHHTAAITRDGNLYVWGDNSCGQLGTGSTTSSFRPIRIMSDVNAVELGHMHSAAVKTNGDLYTWGANKYLDGSGMVGNGQTTNQYTPCRILSNVKEVCLGSITSSAMTSDGKIYMWGNNKNGQFGNDTTTGSLVPVSITTAVEANCFSEGNTSCNTFYATEGSEDVLNKTISYDGMMPNEVYNFYVLKDEHSDTLLSAQNLLYVGQEKTDENGNLTISYCPREQYDEAFILIKGMTRIDISESSITPCDMIYNRVEQYASLNILYGNTQLVEGIDYEVTGSNVNSEIGTYELTVTGIGDYKGTVNTTYKIYCRHYCIDGICILCGFQKGDVDHDGVISSNDYAMLKAIPLGELHVAEQDIYNFDMNDDGAIDAYDAIMLDLRYNNMIDSRVRGDADGNGVLNKADYNFLVSVTTGEEPSTDIVEQLCDLNDDGAIDAYDAIMLDLYLNCMMQIDQPLT